jgi:hypothetical protein
MYKYLSALIILVVLFSCSKKHTPEKSIAEKSIAENAAVLPAKSDSAVVVKKKTINKPRQKDIIPNTIVVNDKAAKKSVDGRLYYDLLGNRYWKNYKNGKYYLFNQKMYDNPAFKAPK